MTEQGIGASVLRKEDFRFVRGRGKYTDDINLPNQTMDIVGDITGNLSGSVGSVTGAGGSVTAETTADVTKISGSATAADNLEQSALGIVPGTVQTGTTTTTIETSLTESVDDVYIGRVIVFLTGTLAGEATDITDYNGTSKALTVTATAQTGANGDTFVII